MVVSFGAEEKISISIHRLKRSYIDEKFPSLKWKSGSNYQTAKLTIGNAEIDFFTAKDEDALCP